MRLLRILSLLLLSVMLAIPLGGCNTPIPPPKAGLKLLVIGHSNAAGSTKQLCQIFDDLGFEDFTLGVLWRGDSTLKIHAANFRNDTAAYLYHRPNLERFSTPEETDNLVSPSVALQDEDWDVIVIHHGSTDQGLAETYDPWLKSLLNTLQDACPKARIYFQALWSYHQDCKTEAFRKFNYDQNLMYQSSMEAIE